MANFAREQLLKYGWTEGKGLGKNENGITEPVKLATNKDNAGIGYDDTVPWWERWFNDAAKNVKVESNPEDEASLSVNNAAWNANGLCPIILKPPEKFSPLENMFAYQKFIEAGKKTMMSIQENRAHAYGPDQKLHAHNSKTVHETTGHNFLGKLGRITEQDINFLNTSNKSQLNAGPVGKNTMDTYRKTNVESDVDAEETEHAIDSIEDILQSEKKNNIVTLSRTTRKKHRKRLNNLVQQLNVCTLEETLKRNWVKSLGNKKCQRMNKNKRDRKDILMNSFKTVNDETFRMLDPFDKPYQFKKKLYNNNPGSYNMKCRFQLILDLSKKKKVMTEQARVGTWDSGSEKDRIGFMVEPLIELRNGTERNGMTEKRYEDWILFDFVNKEARFPRQLYKSHKIFDYYPIEISSKQGISKPKNVEHIDEKKMGSYAIKFDNKIQKKKNSCCHSKQIQKVVDKLKGDALAHELNSVIQNLTTFGISEEVNTIKNKCTQTHRTPV